MSLRLENLVIVCRMWIVEAENRSDNLRNVCVAGESLDNLRNVDS